MFEAFLQNSFGSDKFVDFRFQLSSFFLEDFWKFCAAFMYFLQFDVLFF